MENAAPQRAHAASAEAQTTRDAPPLARDALAVDVRAPRRAAWVRVIVFGTALVGAALIGYVITLPSVSLCTFQNLFGRPCPGCGMTRSIAHLARGDVVQSLRLHPLGIVLFAGSLLGVVGGLLELTRGRDPFYEFVERRGTWIAVSLMSAMIVLWIVRGFIVPEWSPDPIGLPHTFVPPFGTAR